MKMRFVWLSYEGRMMVTIDGSVKCGKQIVMVLCGTERTEAFSLYKEIHFDSVYFNG